MKLLDNRSPAMEIWGMNPDLEQIKQTALVGSALATFSGILFFSLAGVAKPTNILGIRAVRVGIVIFWMLVGGLLRGERVRDLESPWNLAGGGMPGVPDLILFPLLPFSYKGGATTGGGYLMLYGLIMAGNCLLIWRFLLLKPRMAGLNL